MAPTLTVRGHPLLENLEVSLAPVTVFAGPEHSARTSLTGIAWAVLALEPDIVVWFEETVNMGGYKVANRIERDPDEDEDGRGDAEKEPYRLANTVLETLSTALAPRAKKLLKKVPGLGGKEWIEITATGAGGSVKITRDTKGEYTAECTWTANPLDSLRLDHQATRMKSFEIFVGHVISTIGNALKSSLSPWLTGRVLYAVPGRVWLARYVARPWKIRSVPPGPERHYVEQLYLLAEAVASNVVDADLVDPLLRELGSSGIGVVSRAGFKLIAVDLWNGSLVTIDTAPPAMKSTVPLAVALASKLFPTVVVEDPEAHLPARAQAALADLIVTSAANLGKTVVVSTSSEHFTSMLAERAGELAAVYVAKPVAETWRCRVERADPGDIGEEWPSLPVAKPGRRTLPTEAETETA